MDDLDVMKEFRRTTPAYTEQAARQARARLLAAAAAPPRRGRRMVRVGWRLAAVAALSAMIVVGLTVAQNLGVRPGTGADGTPPRPGVLGVQPAPAANAAELLERAASVVGAQPAETPRPDQWIYLKQRQQRGSGPGGVVTGGPSRTVTSEQWRRADGRAWALMRGGKLEVQAQPGTGMWPPEDLATIESLPTDPDALLAWLYWELRKSDGPTGGTDEGRHQSAYIAINVLLRDNVLSPALRAGLYRALARIPGVTLVMATVDAAGRPAVALGRVQEGWLQERILLDPDTFEYLGEQAVAVRDHVAKGDDGTWRVRAGTVQRLEVRLEAAIVDQVGARPRKR
jgi:hypothetical protein